MFRKKLSILETVRDTEI